MRLSAPLLLGTLFLFPSVLPAQSAPNNRAPQLIPAHFPLQMEDLRSTFALQSERLELRKKIAQRHIPKALDAMTTLVVSSDLRSSKTVESPISDAVWGTGLVNYQGPEFRAGIVSALPYFHQLSFRTQRDLLEAIHTLYLPLGPEDPLVQGIRQYVLKPGRGPRMIAMAAVILRSDPGTAKAASVDTPDKLRATLTAALGQDADLSTSPHFRSLLRQADTPPLPTWPATSETLIQALRSPAPRPNSPMLISVQSINRDYPGVIAARRRDGKFVRDSEGQIVLLRQLARSQTNLPGTFSNGNTPSGYMSIQGLALTTGNVFIGPSPMILTELPIEADPKRFFHGQSEDKDWTESAYRALLPAIPALQSQLMEAYSAGEAGRGEILLHGNVTEPGLHARPGPRTPQEVLQTRGNPWAPFGPSMGCATPIEIWDDTTGQCLHSDQIRLVHLLLAADANRDLPVFGEVWPQPGKTPQPTGYLLTLELTPPRAEGFLVADFESVFPAAEQPGPVADDTTKP